MKKSLMMLTAVLAASGGLWAAPTTPVRIALIVQDTVDDKGWCQSMSDAIKAVQKKRGATVVQYSYSEKMQPVDAGSAARQYAAKGFDIVICHGAQYNNVVTEMADEFPKTTFAYGTSANIGPKNVFTYMPESEQSGYLNGIVAGMVTRTGIIGNVGSVDGGDSARYDRGFLLGVHSVNPKAVVKLAHTGSFGDFVKAGELAQTDIKANADVLTGSSQQAMGALRAVAEYKDKPIWYVSQTVSQMKTPEAFKVIGAANYDYVPVVEAMIDKHAAGTLGGECLPITYANKGFSYDFNPKVGPVLTAAIRKAVEKAKADLVSGKLKLDWKSVKLQ